MKIGIDARTLTNKRGIGNVVFHLLHGLSAISSDITYIIYIDDPKAIDFMPNDPRFTCKLIRPKLYPLWEQIALPYHVIKDKLNILHCPGNSAPIFLPKSVKLVLSIMDVMFMFPSDQIPKSPSFYQRGGRQYLKYIVPLAAKNASAITTISSTSRQDILRYIKAVDRDRISVIWLAANNECQEISDNSFLNKTKEKFNLKSHSYFILSLGALDPRKNTSTVLKAFAKFQKTNLLNIQLVIVGLTSGGIVKFKQLAKNLGIENDVVFAGFVTESDLVALYNLATVLLYPSLYEGFGLPVLEAMRCGTAVISSNSGSIPEIAGDAALLVNPRVTEELVQALHLLFSDHQARNDFVIKGRARANMFSWQKMADETFTVYKSLS
jgi:glycosyltransferase involved in cell wall biosynthesis